ncbi:MAG TPA: hypothetical protein VM513_18435 [Kofleriaceae bacterium]|nr:hypothetical protein [Kofleriaceae bacterium]
MRCATLVVAFAMLAACNDLREFRGTWQGPRVGEAPVVRVGAPTSNQATLTIDELDANGFAGTLSIASLVADAQLVSLPGAEADALAGMTFAGSPLRVYLAFASMPDGGGEALVLVALFDDQRIEVRVLRGGSAPLYAIFAMTET